MKKILLTLLGKGQVNIAASAYEYKKATYFIDSPDINYQTPFVFEAIQKLSAYSFDEIHIFGTSESMWHILYLHFSLENNNLNSNYSELIDNAVSSKNIQPSCSELKIVEQELTYFFNKKVFCHRIEIGSNENQIWSILRLFTSLKLDNVALSIDITHGLRFQPLFLLLSLVYYKSLNPNIEYGSMFYGALELTKDSFTQIYDFKLFYDFLNWINAVKVFDYTGNSQMLSNLISSNTQYSFLAEALKELSLSISLSKSNKIYDDLQITLKALSDISQNDYYPLIMVQDYFKNRFASLDSISEKWEFYFNLAKHHYKNHNYGFSVLTLWNSVIERVAIHKNMDVNIRDNYEELSHLACNFEYWRKISPELSEFGIKNNFLRKIRNQIAHTDSESLSAVVILSELSGLINYYSKILFLKTY